MKSGIDPPKLIMRRFIDLDSLHGTGLKRMRESLNLTQRELARISGLSRSTISSIETGRHDPTLGTVMRMRDAMLAYMFKNQRFLNCCKIFDFANMSEKATPFHTVVERSSTNAGDSMGVPIPNFSDVSKCDEHSVGGAMVLLSIEQAAAGRGDSEKESGKASRPGAEKPLSEF